MSSGPADSPSRRRPSSSGPRGARSAPGKRTGARSDADAASTPKSAAHSSPDSWAEARPNARPNARSSARPNANARSTTNARPHASTRSRADAVLPADSLAFALAAAARIVQRVREGASLQDAIGAVAQAGPARGAVQDLAFRAMRRMGCAEFMLNRKVQRPPAPAVSALLICALSLLSEEPPPYAPFTIVDQAVEAAGANADTAFARGLVNAVLRNVLRERDSLLGEAARDPVAHWNHPLWWQERLQQAWPAQWQAILETNNQRPPMTLRVNRRQTSVADYLDRLRSAGLDAEVIGEDGLVLAQPVGVDRLPDFASGAVSVQDYGAQKAARLLDVAEGMRVLDACAAPGGKTGHLLELASIELLALEQQPQRAARIGETLSRLGLAAEVRVGDAAHPEQWWDGRPFDRILADVPCSASGIVRRHPDIRWLRRPGDIAALVETQRRILAALWSTLAVGGELLYVTCSIFPQEGEAQAAWFEQAQKDAVRLSAPGQGLPDPVVAGRVVRQDGFFYARFRKTAA
ncbi:16S rRNA (cytosine(967)-C(5))-methyltransferase RsmB [Chitinasiproducens palmae]|uniref:16S rRNA (cytosine(967)-C(5))-methyltransferase n=1 Tax=Chitinasiproducens palmae TaxID=1770053 RepID=A0A1H2PT33_9BURK|nr:16S rRNA (cytosine(967)-C(5))-methyltransferase RsmB [Chitinasiproducens palmae]SDV50238.1 16S rRNA (cytosine967-C5)-methyltransferase [Chitinasiproducens palmae]